MLSAPSSKRSSPPPTATTPAPKTSPTKPSPSPRPKAWSRQSSAAIETLAAVHPAGAEDRALRLAAAAAHLRDEIGYRLELPAIRRRLDQLLVDARASLGDDFETAWTEGASLTWQEAVAYAQRMRGERRRPTHGWDSLTPTEHDIVALVTEGLTNPQIAERMFIETSTVKSHVHHIFTKLGIATRSELAATASRRPP